MDTHLIHTRRREVEAEIERLQSRLLDMQAELDELAIAEKVVSRLSGAKRPPTGEADEQQPAASAKAKPEGLPTVREMILTALMDSRQRGMDGMRPKDIREFAKRTWHWDMGSAANTVSSRMWREAREIEKDTDSGLFRLPDKEKPADENAVESTSAGFNFNPQHGREAGQGGGT